MPTDSFQLNRDAATGPSRAPFAIVPDDAAELAVLPKAIYIGTGGTVIVRGIDGTEDVVFNNVSSGQVLDVRPSHIRATGTSASDIIGLA